MREHVTAAFCHSIVWNCFLCPESLNLPLENPWDYNSIVAFEFKFFCCGNLK